VTLLKVEIIDLVAESADSSRTSDGVGVPWYGLGVVRVALSNE